MAPRYASPMKRVMAWAITWREMCHEGVNHGRRELWPEVSRRPWST